MVTSSTQLLNLVVIVRQKSNFFTLNHLREACDRDLACLVLVMSDAGLWCVSVYEVSQSCLPVLSETPSIQCLVACRSQRVVPSCSYFDDFLACEICYQTWLHLHLNITPPKLSPVMLSLAATTPRPHLAIQVQCQCMKIATRDHLNPLVLQRSQNRLRPSP